MCIIFNIFVFYTLFNQLNCRVIDDSFNIFVRINKSILFPLICLFEMALQAIIIYIGKSAFHIVDKGRTGEQWGIFLGFSAITFVVSFITKLIPIHNFIDGLIRTKEEENNDLEEMNKEEEEKNNVRNEDKNNAPEEEILSMNDNNKKKIITQKKERTTMNVIFILFIFCIFIFRSKYTYFSENKNLNY